VNKGFAVLSIIILILMVVGVLAPGGWGRGSAAKDMAPAIVPLEACPSDAVSGREFILCDIAFIGYQIEQCCHRDLLYEK
jgi:hypothetical protein